MNCFRREIIRESNEGLARQRWVVQFAGHHRPTLYLAEYAQQQRPSRRHQWRTIGKQFNCHGDKRNFDALPSREVPLPPDVRHEAREAFLAELAFTISHPNHTDAVKP